MFKPCHNSVEDLIIKPLLLLEFKRLQDGDVEGGLGAASASIAGDDSIVDGECGGAASVLPTSVWSAGR